MGYPVQTNRVGHFMTRFGRLGTMLALAATLAGCGGDGGSNTITPSGGGGSGSGSGGTATNGCSLRNRQNWVAAQMNEWYLFPETLPASLAPTPYSTVSDYIDALAATARAQRAAFATFKQQGITQVVVDLRYNGGGAITIADLFNNLLGGNRQTSDVMGYTAFRASKASNNTTTYFAPQAESIVPTRLAFIGTGGTASASELVVNRTLPYMGSNTGLIGANTYGKPVGQIALDKSECDDRLRVIAISIQNANQQGGYYNGLASVVPASCKAGDDLTRKMGDPQEASTRAALDFLQGKTCTPISASTATAQSLSGGARKLLQPERPSVAQRDVPGLF